MSRTTSGAFGVWKTVDFRLLTGGQLLSQLGNQAQSLALPLIVLALTGSTAQAGLLLGVSTSTYLIAGLFAGALVDRWNRKRLMIWCELGRAALAASIPVALLLDALTMTQLYLVAVLTGGLAVLLQAANSAALPHVVRPAQLSQALAAYRAAGSAVSIAGAALAGAAYGVGRAVPFVLNAASFAVSATSSSSSSRTRPARTSFRSDSSSPAQPSADCWADSSHRGSPPAPGSAASPSPWCGPKPSRFRSTRWPPPGGGSRWPCSRVS